MAKRKKQIVKRKHRKSLVTIIDLEDLYKIINKVQINQKEVTFNVADVSIVPTVENIIKDSKLLIRKKTHYRKEVFVLCPSSAEFCKEQNVDEFEKDLFSDNVPNESDHAWDVSNDFKKKKKIEL